MGATTAMRLFSGYAFDLDGTVYMGDALIPGAKELIDDLRQSGARVVFVTNKPLETATEYAAKLTRLGIEATDADVVTAIDALVLYLHTHHDGARCLPVSEPLLRDQLVAARIAVTENPAECDVVVVSFDRTFDYDKLNRAYRAVKHHGAAIVATNPDPYCPTPDGGIPDCAAMLAAIEACTGVTAEAIVGKPSTHMAAAFLDRLAVPPSDAAMVGDRLATDVAMGHAVGMAGVLVMSGATTPEDLAVSPIQPDFVLPDITALFPR